MGVNKFTDMTEEEFLKVYGTLQENGEEYELTKYNKQRRVLNDD